MVTIILLLMMLISFVCLFMKKTVSSLIIMGSAIAWLYLNASGLMPRLLMSGLEIHPRLDTAVWEKNNAIILLGAGSFQWEEAGSFKTHPLGLSRIFEAARIYSLCKKQQAPCKIIASGGDPNEKGISEAKVMQLELMQFGIPEQDIILEGKSKNTLENAKYSASIIKDQSFDHVIVVTSGFHLLRSLILFSHYNIKASPAPSEGFSFFFSLWPKTSNVYLADKAFHEYGGLIKFYLYNFAGLKY